MLMLIVVPGSPVSLTEVWEIQEEGSSFEVSHTSNPS